MRALLRVGLAVLLVGAIAFAWRASEVDADLENQVFTSKPDGLRIVIPRYWRATDQPSYPGVLLWMMRSEPEGRIALTVEPFTHALYCSWPVTCRTSHDALSAKYACALRQRLQAEDMRLGAVQAGPKDNEEVGLASVWFEYDDGKHFLRQAVAVTNDRAISLVLSAASVDNRATLARPFEQALRTLRPLTAAEVAGSDSSGNAMDASGAVTTAALVADAGALAGSAVADAGSAVLDAGAPHDAAGLVDAALVMSPPSRDAGLLDAGVSFSSAPAPRVTAVGPCN